jgi:phosphomannomutase
MKKRDAKIGGEYSCHFYFKERQMYLDSGILAAIHVLNILSSQSLSFSNLIAPYKKYAISDVINFKVVDPDAALQRIDASFKGKKEHIDGITVRGDDFWLNVRKSHTEPLVRIRAEAHSKQKLKEIIALAKNIVTAKFIKE